MVCRATMVALLVGFSRLYLCVRYFRDAMGGIV
jgi:hypothetical protein